VDPKQEQEQVVEAYQKYIRTLQDPGAPAEAQQRVTDAYKAMSRRRSRPGILKNFRNNL